MRSIIVDYMRLMRISVAGGMALPLVYGAISVNNYSFSVLFPLFIIGVLSGIYGFVLNDYVDADLDKLSVDLSKRPLVRKSISKKTAIGIIILCFLGAYACIFLFFYRNHFLFFTGLLCVIVADVLGFIYNRYGKQIIGSDFLIAIGESLFFLFGAIMVLDNGNFSILTWILFILIFNHLLFTNAIAGGLKDADHDYLMQVKNIALASGVTITQNKRVFIPLSFKTLGMGIRCFSAILVFVPFVFYGISYEFWQIILLILLVALLLYTSSMMLTIKQFERNTLRKLIIIQLSAHYSIIPIMLISIIDPVYAFILIVFPVTWYVFFSCLIGEKLLEPQI